MAAKITLLGEQFEVAERVGLMALLRFAHLAKGGMRTDDMEAFAVIYEVLRSVIADGDWPRFESHATLARADVEELLGCVREAIALVTARPTKRPGGSSDGPTTTEMSSPDDSSWLVFSAPSDDTPPILMDPRVQELVPVGRVAGSRR